MYQRLEPIDPRYAFEVVAAQDSETTQSAAASQAALLLAARAGVLGISDELLAELERETEGVPFELPPLRPLERQRRLRVAEATSRLGMSKTELRSERPERVQEEMATTVNRLYDQPDTENAAALFEAGMLSPHLLVRVAAAAGARETTRLRKRIRAILEEGAASTDATIREVARTALGRIDRDDPELQKHVAESPPSAKRNRESNTAVISHGTWAPDQAWYQPGGDFYESLKANRPDLDVHDMSFRWSGGYSDTARRTAAGQLETWIGDQGLGVPDFFAHSHGGTVANLATKRGVAFDRLVLMGWPVHDQWMPDPGMVARLIDIRVKLDLVILLDRGGQRFPAGQRPADEHRNGWFDHASVHEPGYWDDHGLWAVL